MAEETAEQEKQSSPLLKALVERRAKLEAALMDDPKYKEMCAVNYLIEREYIRLTDEPPYLWYDMGYADIVANHLGGSEDFVEVPAPATSGGAAFVSELAKERLQPQDQVAEEAGPTVAPTEEPTEPDEENSLPAAPPNSGKTREQYEWTDQNKADLLKLREKGWSWRNIGNYLGRTPAACCTMPSQLKKKGTTATATGEGRCVVQVKADVMQMLKDEGAVDNDGHYTGKRGASRKTVGPSGMDFSGDNLNVSN